MNPLLESLVTTNSGWLARQMIKWTAVLTAIIATHLAAKGLPADESTLIATTVSSVVFGIVEFVLSFIARRYKVDAADKLKLDIEKMRNEPPTVRLPLVVLGALCLLLLPACEQMRAFVVVNEPLIEETLVYGVRTGVKAGVKRLETSAKQPVKVTP